MQRSHRPSPFITFADEDAPHVAAAAVIAPTWGRFLSTYPEVHLEVALGEAPIDIVAKGFDAGIGPHDRVPADKIAVRVMGPMKIAVVGAPSYFAKAAAATHAG
jgi:DNA-binding transcriptional LysR family regulator